MAARDQVLDAQILAEKLLTAGAAAEQELLRSERKAEKRLADAMASLARDEARSRRAQERLERSRGAGTPAPETLSEGEGDPAPRPPGGEE